MLKITVASISDLLFVTIISSILFLSHYLFHSSPISKVKQCLQTQHLQNLYKSLYESKR